MVRVRKAIVSGHSRGLGAELAVQLVRAGYLTFGLSRAEGAVPGVSLDLSDPAALVDWLATPALAEFLAGSDEIVLINNAGTVQPVGPVDSPLPSEVIRAVNLNVTAAMLLTSATIAAKPAKATLKIVHISSGAARHPYGGWSVYCATKASLDMHARCIAEEQHPGVAISSIAPGVVDTDMQREIRAADSFEHRDRFVEMHTRGRLTSPAKAAAMLIEKLRTDDFGTKPLDDVRG